MDKIPLIPVNEGLTVTLWYEGPTFLIADKPAGMATHPADATGSGTLVNALLQSNRWLAEMETSITPGLIHQLRDQDRGLTLVAKSDEMATTLRNTYHEQSITFSYRVRMPNDISPREIDSVTVYDRHEYDDITVYDIDSTLGDTGELSQEWLGDRETSASFVCYQMDVPTTSKRFRIGLAQRIILPEIDLYTAPT